MPRLSKKEAALASARAKAEARVVRCPYDDRAPQFSRLGVWGCGVCEPSPPLCPFTDLGSECECAGLCDAKVKYEPTRRFPTREAVAEHMKTHGLTWEPRKPGELKS